MVQVWHWYVSVGRKMEFMILLFVSIGISDCFSSGASSLRIIAHKVTQRRAQVCIATCQDFIPSQ